MTSTTSRLAATFRGAGLGNEDFMGIDLGCEMLIHRQHDAAGDVNA